MSNKRSKSKYPALNPNLNLKRRAEFLEIDYLDQLDDEGKEFLNRFHEETINTNFLNHPELKRLNDVKKAIINTVEVEEYTQRIKELKDRIEGYKTGSVSVPTADSIHTLNKDIKRLETARRELKKDIKIQYAKELEDIEDQMQKIRDKHFLYPDKKDHRQFYDENNTRNTDLQLNLKITKTLFQLDQKNVNEFDVFTYNGRGIQDYQELQNTQMESVYDELEDLERFLNMEFDDQMSELTCRGQKKKGMTKEQARKQIMNLREMYPDLIKTDQ